MSEETEIQAALRAVVEVPTTATLWGDPHTFTPAVCSKVFGDGRALLKLWALATRPSFYVIRIDSRWKVDDYGAPDGAPDLWDHIDNIYDALVDDYGDAGPHEGDDGEFTLEWPAFDGDNGAAWDRMDWPLLAGWTFERHGFASCNVLRADTRPGGGAYMSELTSGERHAVIDGMGAGFAPGAPLGFREWPGIELQDAEGRKLEARAFDKLFGEGGVG